MLARRLYVDIVLLAFAFQGLDEAADQQELRTVIDELQKEAF
jgi:hypothetical protein